MDIPRYKWTERQRTKRQEDKDTKGQRDKRSDAWKPVERQVTNNEQDLAKS
jgi:hypothetical protein